MRKHLPSLSVFLLLLGMWEFIVRYFRIENYILPAPSQIGTAMRHTGLLLWQHGRGRSGSFAGICLAVVCGLFLAVIMGLIPFKRTLIPCGNIPDRATIALAPPIFVWLWDAA